MLPDVLGGTNTERLTLSKRLATKLGEQSLRRWGTGLGALTLAVSGLFGGLKVAQPDPPPVAATGAAVDGGAYRVTVEKVQLHLELKPILLSKKENHFIVVVATIEVTADKSWTLLSGILKLSGVEGVVGEYPQVALVKDGGPVRVLHPGMPEQIAFFWEQSSTAAIPKQVTIQVMGWQYRASSLDGTHAGKQWLDDREPRAELVLPVDDRRSRDLASSASPSPTASPKATPTATPKATPTASPRAS